MPFLIETSLCRTPPSGDFLSISEKNECNTAQHLGMMLPCRFCNGRVMMPPAAAAATSPWMFVRFAVGSVRTRPCWPPSCPAMLKGMRMGWLRAGGPPGITPATAEASCCAVRRGCKTGETWLTFQQNNTWFLMHGASIIANQKVPQAAKKHTPSQERRLGGGKNSLTLCFVYTFENFHIFYNLRDA